MSISSCSPPHSGAAWPSAACDRPSIAQHKVWFAAQVLNGGYTGLVLAWKSRLPKVDPETEQPLGLAVWPSDEIALVYTGIAGMLNLLLLIDLLLRPWIRNPKSPTAPIVSAPNSP